MMKKIFITCVLVCGIINYSYSQKEIQTISNDTIVCIVDTTLSYVTYAKDTAKNGAICWQVNIKGHYYDTVYKDEEWRNYAGVSFNRDFPKWITRPYEIKILKNSLQKRFKVYTDDWINQQLDLDEIGKKIGYRPSNYNYIVFKQDLKNKCSKYVILYKCIISYGTIHVDSFPSL